jgi:hypothetical protein
MERVGRKIEALEFTTGRAMIAKIIEIFALKREKGKLHDAIGRTVRIWAAGMMQMKRTEMHAWLINKFRGALMSLYIKGDENRTDDIDIPTYNLYIGMWQNFQENVQDPALARDRSEMAETFERVFIKRPAARVPSTDPMYPYFSGESTYIGESVLYSNAVMPLVLTVAALFTYIDAVDDNAVMHGTQTLRPPVVMPFLREIETGLLSYATFIAHHMNKSLAGSIVGRNGIPVVTDWAPVGMGQYTGANIAETARNLIPMLEFQNTAETASMALALRASLLVIDGNPAPPVEADKEIADMTELFSNMMT